MRSVSSLQSKWHKSESLRVLVNFLLTKQGEVVTKDEIKQIILFGRRLKKYKEKRKSEWSHFTGKQWRAKKSKARGRTRNDILRLIQADLLYPDKKKYKDQKEYTVAIGYDLLKYLTTPSKE